MPLPKLKYSREQLEGIRVAVAANGWKMPKLQVAPASQIRAEDLESTLLKGGASSSAPAKDRDRDERRVADRRDERSGDRDHRGGAPRDHDDWGGRARNRNREAFEEGYDYELQMKAQNRNDLQEALKAEEIRVAVKKRKDDEERRKREEIEQEEKAIQQQEEQGKIYEAQQMFGVAGVDERDTVWGAPAAKKHSRFAFQDVEDDEEKKPRGPVAPVAQDALDPFSGVKVSSAVHLPPQPVATHGAVIAGVTPPPIPAPASSREQTQQQAKPAANANQNPNAAHPNNNASSKSHGQDSGQKQSSQSESGRQRREDKHHGSNARQGQQPKNPPAQSSPSAPAATAQPFVDPCIVSMSTDPLAKGPRADAPTPQAAPQNASNAASKGQPKTEASATSPSVSALFAKFNIGASSSPAAAGGVGGLHGAVDASLLEMQLRNRNAPLEAQSSGPLPPPPQAQPAYPPRAPAAVAPQPVAPNSPPQKSAPPPPYQAQPPTTNPNTPPMMPMTVGGQQIHVAGHPGFLMMPQGYPLRPGQLYYPQQYFQMPPPPPQGAQGQGRSY